MLRFIMILGFLIIATWLGLMVIQHPGYLLFVMPPWTMRVSLGMALGVCVLFIVIFYLIIHTVLQLQFLWMRFKNWLHWRRIERAFHHTQQGLLYLIEGRFKQAERLLIKGMRHTSNVAINLLGAAQAAHALGAERRKELYLAEAYEKTPQAQLAIGLTIVALAYRDEQFDKAKIILDRLQQTFTNQPEILRWLEKLYVRLADWPALLALLPALRKAKVLTKTQYLQFEKNVYCEMFKHIIAHHQLASVEQLWHRAPYAIRMQTEVIFYYAKALMHFNQTRTVEKLIRKTLKYHYHEGLVTLYGTLPFGQLNRQLIIVGAWLKLYGEQHALLFTLGRLCVRAQLWGRAKDYFEKCLSLNASPAVSLAYGKLLEQLGEREAALEQYRHTLIKTL